MARDKDGALRKIMMDTLDGDYQAMKANDGAFVRKNFFGRDPRTLEMVSKMSDDDIWALRRGGHDASKVYAAFHRANNHKGQPTVILAKTVKGYGMGAAGESQNPTHQQKKLDDEAVRHFRDRFNIPIPDSGKSDREAIGNLAELCSSVASKRYELEISFQRRLIQSFGEDSQCQSLGPLNNKAQAWWEQSLNELGDALKASFKLKSNPFKKPQTADEWEPYLAEKRSALESLTRQLSDAEAEINARVYKLFDLTPSEISLLQREVEH